MDKEKFIEAFIPFQLTYGILPPGRYVRVQTPQGSVFISYEAIRLMCRLGILPKSVMFYDN